MQTCEKCVFGNSHYAAFNNAGECTTEESVGVNWAIRRTKLDHFFSHRANTLGILE